MLIFDVPFDAQEGVYDLSVEVSNDDVRRVKFREFNVLSS